MKQIIFLTFYFQLICFALCGREQVVILGSGPAGLTAGIYAARAGLSTLVLEGEEPGGQIALSYLVENFPGFPQGINGYQLTENMREQLIHAGARLRSGKVIEVDISRRPFLIKLEDDELIETQTLIIATGASPRWLGLESEKALIGKGVCSCAVCDGVLFKGKEVVVVGGGDAALEDALFLSKYASKVTVIHRRDTLRASKHLQKIAFANPKIHFIWNAIVEEIQNPLEGKVTGVALRDLPSHQTSVLPCQGVFMAIGHIPNSTLFQGQLPIDAEGHIQVHPFSTETAVPGVFAAGDVVDSRYRQAITAAGTGCMAGMDASRFIQEHDNNQPQESL